MNALEWNAILPNNISQIIDRSGMKQGAVAVRAGISPKQFSEMLHGRKIIKAVDIINISRALGVTPNEIFGIRSDRKAS
jgi:transcriptional regulator with XRE-family HTH domain